MTVTTFNQSASRLCMTNDDKDSDMQKARGKKVNFQMTISTVYILKNKIITAVEH